MVLSTSNDSKLEVYRSRNLMWRNCKIQAHACLSTRMCVCLRGYVYVHAHACLSTHVCVCLCYSGDALVLYYGCLKFLFNIYHLLVSRKLLKGSHVIQGMKVKVKMADHPPTSQQIKNAAFIADEDRMPIRSSSKKKAVEEPYQSHSMPRDRSQPSSNSRTVPVETYQPSGTPGPVGMYLTTSPQQKVQLGTVVQSTDNPWPDPFDNDNDGQNILHIPPLEDAHGSSDNVGVRQPVGPHPLISGGQYTNGAPHELQKRITMIEPHPVTSDNMLHNSKRAPLRRKEVGEETASDFSMEDESHSIQPPPVLSIKVEGFPKDWDESVLEMAFDNPDLGGGEIASMRGDVITFKDPKSQFPWLRHLMIVMIQH